MLHNHKKNLIILLVIAIIGFFLIATIRAGHDWGDDFAMYIHHAKNIAEGKNYSDTGYIYNPHYVQGPKIYPPVLPLVLSPVYKIFGLNLEAMKIELVIIFLIFLYIFFLSMEKWLPLHYIAAVIAIIGLNPVFWEAKDTILSEFPFIFFTYLALLLFSRIYNKLHTGEKVPWYYVLLISAAIYLSYGTRQIGLVLLPALFVWEIIKFKKISKFTIGVILISIFFIGLQKLILPSDTYSENSLIGIKYILRNLSLYWRTPMDFWQDGSGNRIIEKVLFLFFSLAAIVGYWKQFKNKLTVYEVFFLFYIVTIIIFPAYVVRYVMPIFPLYVYYAFLGIRNLNNFKVKKIETVVYVFLLMAVFAGYTGKYLKKDFRPIQSSVTNKESAELFDYIKKNTDKDDIFIFFKPRALSLYTGRSGSAVAVYDVVYKPYEVQQTNEELWNYINRIKASHIISSPLFDNEYFRLFIEKHGRDLEEMWSNKNFYIYKINKLTSIL